MLYFSGLHGDTNWFCLRMAVIQRGKLSIQPNGVGGTNVFVRDLTAGRFAQPWRITIHAVMWMGI